MLVNVGFSSEQLYHRLWDSLKLQAQGLGIELALLTQDDSLYFSDQASNPIVLTLVAPDGEFPLEDFTDQSLKLLLCWHRDRATLESMRIHRHTLGNLIVIFLSRTIQLEYKIEAQEHEAMMKLHTRLTDLYGEFEKINNYRTKRIPQKNA
jgi:hypothetical protein